MIEPIRVITARAVQASRRATGALPWLVSASLLVCLILVAGQGIQPPQSQPGLKTARELRAERFIVVDGAGRERAELGVRSDGGAELVVRYENGEVAAWVASLDKIDAPVVAVCGRDGQRLGELSVLDDVPMFVLHHPSGQRRIALYVTRKENEACVDVFSKSGKSLCTLRANAEGSPRLLVRDEEGRSRILLGAVQDGSCVLDLSDSRRTRLRAAVTGKGEPGLVTFDTAGKPDWWHSK